MMLIIVVSQLILCYRHACKVFGWCWLAELPCAYPEPSLGPVSDRALVTCVKSNIISVQLYGNDDGLL